MSQCFSNPAPLDSSNRIEGWKPVQIIQIADAVYCADCDAITEAKNGHCLACGHGSIVHVEKLMNHQLQGSGVRDQGLADAKSSNANPQPLIPNPSSSPEAR